MATIQEAQQSLQETQQSLLSRQQQISQAEQEVKNFQPNITRTQSFLRTAPQGTNVLTQQARMREVERQRSLAKEQAQKQVQTAKAEQAKYQQELAKYQQDLEQFLQSTEGKVQIAEESGYTKEPTYGRFSATGEKVQTGFQYYDKEGKPYVTYTFEDFDLDYKQSLQEYAETYGKYKAPELKQFNKTLDERGRVVLPGVQAMSTESSMMSSENPEVLAKLRGEVRSVGIPEKKTGLAIIPEGLSRYLSKLETKGMRGEKLTAIEQVGSFGAGVGSAVVGLAQGIIGAPKLAFSLATKPIRTTEALGTGILESGKALGTQIRFNPSAAVGRIAGEVAVSKGGGVVLEKVSALVKPSLTKLPLGVSREIITTPSGMKFIKETLPRDVSNTAKATAQPIIKAGEQLDLIKVYTKRDIPIQSAELSSPISRIFFEPKQIKLSGPRTDYAITPNVIVLKEGIIQNAPKVVTKRQGGDLMFVSKIEGGEIGPIDLAEIPKLSRGKEYALQQMALKSPFISKDIIPEFSGGIIESTNLYRLSPNAKRLSDKIRLAPIGRRTSRFETVSRAFKVAETPESTVFRTTTAVKDISKPLYKRIGKVPIIEGEVLVKKPIFIDDVGGTLIIPGRKTLNVLMQKNVQATANILGAVSKKFKASPIIRTTAKPTSKPIISLKSISDNYPLIVGGSGVVRSSFAGKGVYEKTESFMIPKITGYSVMETPQERKETQFKSIPISRLDQETPTILREEPKSRVISFFGTPQAFREATILRPLERSRFRELVILREAQLQKQQSLVVRPSIPITKPFLRTIPPTRIRGPRLRVPSPEDESPKRFLKGKKKKSLLIPEIRRRGKFLQLPGRASLREAFAAATRAGKETLGASIRVRESSTGRTVKIPTPFGFRSSRKEPGVQIQKRGKRLSSRSEVFEIQRARRSKKMFNL